VGAVLVAYNLSVYGTPGEPFTRQRGVFLSEVFWPHLAFYAGALMVIWPGMLLAPLFDRSPLRWLTRGAIAVFLGPLLFYYFHDRAPGWFATAVLGQRLIQVALPLWVVGYAGVVDDSLARPLRKRLGETAWRGLVALACLVLVAGTGMMFDRHQAHLRALRQGRDAVVARVPAGSLIVYSGAFQKLVGTPVGIPTYRLHALDWMYSQPIDPPEKVDRFLAGERGPWYLAVLRREPGEPLTEYIRDVISRHHLREIPLGSPVVSLYGPAKPAAP
jgi:hypothetical protein